MSTVGCFDYGCGLIKPIEKKLTFLSPFFNCLKDQTVYYRGFENIFDREKRSRGPRNSFDGDGDDGDDGDEATIVRGSFDI